MMHVNCLCVYDPGQVHAAKVSSTEIGHPVYYNYTYNNPYGIVDVRQQEWPNHPEFWGK